MDWLIRFWLGLQCRREDYIYVQEHFPELLDHDLVVRPRLWLPFWYPGDPDEVLPGLRMWLRDGQEEAESLERRQLSNVNVNECPARDCPLKENPASSTPNQPASDESTVALPPINIILGGDNHPPKKAFLDLVRKHHSGGKGVKQVIITDPYLLADTGETGENGGYRNAVEYLQALGLTKTSEFELLTNPRTTQNSNSKQIFDRAINEAFPKAKLDFYKSRYRFHDRLYLVRDSKSIISGVFGPSLNGLSSDSIVLLGEIDERAGLAAIRRMFQ